MRKKQQIKIQLSAIEQHLLDNVQMPGRYIGSEVNQIRKDLCQMDLTVALCFPDVYEVAMSNTGIGIIYHILNGRENIAAERVFAPWIDAEEIMRDKKIPLFSLESKASVSDFDIVGFSISNELCYTNILNMLDLAGISLRSKDRSDDEPLVIAGGTMGNCCEPIADFIDIFLIGEGEEASILLCELIIELKRQSCSRLEILKAIDAEFSWAYVPQFYSFDYQDDKIIAMKPERKFTNAVVRDFENAPVSTNPIVPFIDTVHERITIEIMRGCPGRCRFCQASYLRRPLRWRSAEKIFDIAKKSYDSTGFDTISLLSLSSADYPHLEELFELMFGYFPQKQVGLSLPSLRVDQQLKLLPKYVKNVRKSGLTIAVEAAPERIRQMINKPLTNENLFAGVEAAYAAGWSKLKMYFMVGFTSETEDDIRDIVDLSVDLAKLRKKFANRPADLNIAVSWLVPKPHTPFGWMGQKSRAYFENARKIILDRKRQLGARFLNIKFHNIGQSVLESAIGRGDRRLSLVIESAWRNGAKYDLWNEHFNFEIWQRAFANHNLDIDRCSQRDFGFNEVLPWQHLSGPRLEYLRHHCDKAMKTVNQ